MTTSRTAAQMFCKAISMEIDKHAPLDFEELFELAHYYVDPTSDDAILTAEDLAADVADMLESARALA